MKVYIKIPVEKELPETKGYYAVIKKSILEFIAVERIRNDIGFDYVGSPVTHWLKEIDLSELMKLYFKWHKDQGFLSHKESDINQFLTEKGYIQL